MQTGITIASKWHQSLTQSKKKILISLINCLVAFAEEMNFLSLFILLIQCSVLDSTSSMFVSPHSVLAEWINIFLFLSQSLPSKTICIEPATWNLGDQRKTSSQMFLWIKIILNNYSMSACWIWVGYNYLTSNKHGWNNCLIKFF